MSRGLGLGENSDKLAELKKEYNVTEDDAFFAQQAPALPMMPGMEPDQNAQPQKIQLSSYGIIQALLRAEEKKKKHR